MAKQIVRYDRIELMGQDISPLVTSWELVSPVQEIRRVRLEILVDDDFTVNGRTVAEMLGLDPADPNRKPGS